MSKKADQPRAPALIEAAQPAAQLSQSLTPLRLCLRIDEIGKALDGGEVELAIEEPTTGEFAGLRQAQAGQLGQGGQHAGRRGAATVDLKLGHVLPRLASRAGEPEHKGVVQGRAVLRIPQPSEGAPPRLRQGDPPTQFREGHSGSRSTDANDRNGGPSRRAGERKDGVVGFHWQVPCNEKRERAYFPLRSPPPAPASCDQNAFCICSQPCRPPGNQVFSTVSGSMAVSAWRMRSSRSARRLCWMNVRSGKPRNIRASWGVQSISIFTFMRRLHNSGVAPGGARLALCCTLRLRHRAGKCTSGLARPVANPRCAMSENQLASETSPYLLQHKNNPVAWRPWGPAVLEEARRLDRPILFSIGYAACHWCHVMAHESFEDPATAAVMNELFVNVKVDREERPDLDSIYQQALALMGEQGGWPLTMFCTPDGEPFWGGTYFPPEPRYGRPGFKDLLRRVAEIYHKEKAAVRHNVDALKEALTRLSRSESGGGISLAMIDQAARQLVAQVDMAQGGIGPAPKFPQAPIFKLLWRAYKRTGQEVYRDAVLVTLIRMSQGGIYDHLGGGFARYSTDAEWLVPHFEKMLYDNAQLLELLTGAWLETGNPLFAARVKETVGWLLRDMTADGACFAASEDADSEGEEGRFYVWTEAEIDALLGADAAAFKAAYDVTAAGNWKGKTILRRLIPLGDEATEAQLASCRNVLFAARAKRVRPGRDDKVLADWNGLAIAALARAAAVFGRPDWLERAAAAFDDVLARLGAGDGRVHHAWRLGKVTAAGLLEDQTAMARAALTLYEATGAPGRLAQAIRLANAALAHFADGEGGFFGSADDATDVPLARPRGAADNATPSGNGMIAEVFARLHHLTGEAAWRVHCEGVLRAFSGRREALPTMPGLLAAADLLEEGASVVIAGPPDAPLARRLAAAALAAPDPATIVLRAPTADALPPAHPAHGKGAGAAGAAAYVCRRSVCGLPISDPGALARTLRTRGAANR